MTLAALRRETGCAKNGESRTVPINEVLTTTLKAVKLQSTDGEKVFCSPQGTPYPSFRTTFQRVVRPAGLADFTFHDLRHTLVLRFIISAQVASPGKALNQGKNSKLT